jgi:hypothetical protein
MSNVRRHNRTRAYSKFVLHIHEALLTFTIVAVLFVGEAVHVAYEAQATEIQTFVVQNDENGAKELSSRLRTVLEAAPGKPLVCMGAAEGSSLHGAVFEQTVFDERVRRFMYFQPKYLLEAKAAGVSSESPAALLEVCYEVFPPTKRDQE